MSASGKRSRNFNFANAARRASEAAAAAVALTKRSRQPQSNNAARKAAEAKTEAARKAAKTVSVFTISGEIPNNAPRLPNGINNKTLREAAKQYTNMKIQQSIDKPLPEPAFIRNYLSPEYTKLGQYPRHGYVIARMNPNGSKKVLVKIDPLFDNFYLIKPAPINVNALLKGNNKKNAGYVAKLFRNALNYLGQIRKKEKNIHNAGLFYHKLHNKGANIYKLHKGKVGHDASTKKIFLMKEYIKSSNKNERPRNNIKVFNRSGKLVNMKTTNLNMIFPKSVYNPN